jgi:hypothetical protein
MTQYDRCELQEYSWGLMIPTNATKSLHALLSCPKINPASIDVNAKSVLDWAREHDSSMRAKQSQSHVGLPWPSPNLILVALEQAVEAPEVSDVSTLLDVRRHPDADDARLEAMRVYHMLSSSHCTSARSAASRMLSTGRGTRI